MTYQMITLNENDKSRTIWGTFSYPAEDPQRVIDFLHYLQTSARPGDFLVHELETDRAFRFTAVLPAMIRKLLTQDHTD